MSDEYKVPVPWVAKLMRLGLEGQGLEDVIDMIRWANDDGYSAGHNDGYGEGHSAGHTQGYSLGWSSGYDEGHTDGCNEAYE